jgi:hypothetical protein
MRLRAVTAMVFLLAAVVPAAYAQDTPAASNSPVVRASDFKPPLSAGKQRKYDQTASTVAKAVREAMKSGPFKLLSEQAVGLMTVFEAITRSSRNMQARDKVRIVVEPLSEKQTAVRVLWPAAAGFPPGSTAEDLYFRAIELRLK